MLNGFVFFTSFNLQTKRLSSWSWLCAALALWLFKFSYLSAGICLFSDMSTDTYSLLCHHLTRSMVKTTHCWLSLPPLVTLWFVLWSVAHLLLLRRLLTRRSAGMCVSVSEDAELVPQTFVFLWDPLNSTTLSPKRFQWPMGRSVWPKGSEQGVTNLQR